MPTGAALMLQSSHIGTHPSMSIASCSTKTESKPEPTHETTALLNGVPLHSSDFSLGSRENG